jgi:hypothetical protein
MMKLQAFPALHSPRLLPVASYVEKRRQVHAAREIFLFPNGGAFTKMRPTGSLGVFSQVQQWNEALMFQVIQGENL